MVTSAFMVADATDGREKMNEVPPAQSASVATLTGPTFDLEVSAPQPILVDFWAEGCGPCRALAPILDELARELAGQLRIAKLRLDQAPALVGRFEITALPTLILFSGGQPRKRITGVIERDALRRELRELLP
jgi:thioredoxin